MRGSEVSGEGVKYRPDIDGLRAIAVLSVVLYHFGIGGLRGGFVGVDVFFVISGYLITGIIHSELQRGEFTLARFYERRARRIFPALFVVLLATMVAGLWILLPSDLARLGQSSVATILFVSNLQYFRESGYFDSSSEFNPLLHTWSLGVEEQFYLGLPLLLMVVWKFWPRGLGRVLAACAILSFVACVAVQPIVAKAAFFLSPFRAWELLLGSMLGIGAIPRIEGKTRRNGIAVVALAALLGAAAFMQSGIDFPGWKAAVPVIATAALLHVGASGGSFVGRLLSWKPLVFVGLVSYSLYLWHWPLLVLAKYRNAMEPLPPAFSLGLCAAAFLLAVGSYYWVEQPFRKSRRDGVRATSGKVFAVSGAVAAVLVSAGIGLKIYDGLPMRVPEQVAALDRERMPVIPFQNCDKELPDTNLGNCVIGSKDAKTRALVWGDSHALAWLPGLDEALSSKGERGSLAIMSACAPLLGVTNPKNLQCSAFNDEVIEWVRHAKIDRVYLVAAWYAWSNSGEGYGLIDIASGRRGNRDVFGPAFGRTVEQLQPLVKEIVVIGPTPGAVKALPYKLAMAEWRDLDMPQAVSRMRNQERARNFWGGVRPYAGSVTLVDPESWFCGKRDCRYEDGGVLLYRDGNHLNSEGARFAARHVTARNIQPFIPSPAGAAN
jgi:peptidoglycan/LPS O-acetylase OafA/YrhL